MEYLRGNITRKVVPTSCTDSISIVASSSSHKRFTIDKPIPSPAPSGGADISAPRGAEGPRWAALSRSTRESVTRGEESASANNESDPVCRPGPVSLTDNVQRPGSLGVLSPQLTVIPPPCVNLTAFRTTRPSWCRTYDNHLSA